MSWEENDIEIMEKIKEKTENLEIPETLLPENMMKKLENEEHRKKKVRRRIIEVMAAAACIGAVAVSMWQLQDKKEPYLSRNNTVKLSVNEDYASICEKLKNVKESRISDYDIIGELDGSLLTNDMAESENKSAVDKVYGTNVQVEGIDEADVVKNDSKYIYALDMTCNNVSIISMEQEKKVSDIQVIEGYLTLTNAEMYVSDDILVVIGTHADNETNIYIYDISDIVNPVQVNAISQQGNYDTSRLTGDYLYVMTNSYIKGKVSEDNCVPRLEGKQIEAGCVSISENVTSLEYEFIISIDLRSPDTVLDKKAVTKNTANGYTYMSEENIYVTNYSYKDDITFIAKTGYKDGKFLDVIEGNVAGRLYGQFAMDEYNGYLRLVTTDAKDQAFIDDGRRETNIVYVLDGSLQEIGKIEGIADGESIYSARFMGDTGYFVTYYQTDPLFKVDFSDPANPVIAGQLEITGYSDYLHLWEDDKLMGLGKVDGEMKLSMFQLSDNGDMDEITREVLEYCYDSPASYNHNALMISPKANLIGFTTAIYKEAYEELTYEVYSYVDGKFVKRISEKILEMNWEEYGESTMGKYENGYNTRGVYAGEKLYIVVPGEKVSIYNINTMESLGSINIGK